jgi:hypothetical protein
MLSAPSYSHGDASRSQFPIYSNGQEAYDNNQFTKYAVEGIYCRLALTALATAIHLLPELTHPTRLAIALKRCAK